MKAFTKIAAAAVAAGGLMAAAAPANALIYLSFAESQSGASMTWNRDDSDQLGGTLTAGGQIVLNIFDNALTDGPLSITANFSLLGNDGAVATKNGQDTNQWTVTGDFSFVAANAFVYDGINYNAGTNLLSASFVNADFGGNGFTGRFSATQGVGDASVNFTSEILSDVAVFSLDTFVFEFAANAVDGPFAADNCPALFGACGNSLEDITGATRGTFSAAIPEPGTWALMILGFGGAGAMLRSRRRGLAVA